MSGIVHKSVKKLSIVISRPQSVWRTPNSGNNRRNRRFNGQGECNYNYPCQVNQNGGNRGRRFRMQDGSNGWGQNRFRGNTNGYSMQKMGGNGDGFGQGMRSNGGRGQGRCGNQGRGCQRGFGWQESEEGGTNQRRGQGQGWRNGGGRGQGGQGRRMKSKNFPDDL